MTYNKGNGAGIQFIRDNVPCTSNECLIWPMSRDGLNGYGRLGYNGKLYWAHRLMCELAHGPAPTEKHEAAHSCGRGRNGCVNPRHLSWKTIKENARDRVRHGRNAGTKFGNRTHLRPSDVADILTRAMTQQAYAEKYGISIRAVQRWQYLNKLPAPPGMSRMAIWRRQRRQSRAS